MKRFILCSTLLALTAGKAAAQLVDQPIPFYADDRFGDYLDRYNVNTEFDEAAKSSDFGLDLSLEASKKFGSRLSASLGVNVRTQDNSRDMQRRMLSLGLGYKLVDTRKFDLKLGFDFDYYGVKKMAETEYFEKFAEHYKDDDVTGELILDSDGNPIFNGYNYRKGFKVTDAHWRTRERYSLSLAGTFKPNKRWAFTLKETFQYSHYNATGPLSRTRTTTERHKWREAYIIDDLYDDAWNALPYHLDSDEDPDGANSMLYYDRNIYGLNGENKPFELGTTAVYDEKGNEVYPAKGPDTPYTEQDDKSPRVAKDKFVLRSKLTVEYDIYGLPLTPYASVDYGCGLNYNTSKWKLTAGMDWKVSKQHKFSIFYRFQHENDDEEPNGHLLGLGYKITL